MCRLWTFCFDEPATLRKFTSMARHLPVRHLQVMLYAHHSLYGAMAAGCGTASAWQRKMDASWERQLQEVDALCRTIPQLGTVLLSVHATPRFIKLENEDAVMESLGTITAAAPRVRVECLTRRLKGTGRGC